MEEDDEYAVRCVVDHGLVGGLSNRRGYCPATRDRPNPYDRLSIQKCIPTQLISRLFWKEEGTLSIKIAQVVCVINYLLAVIRTQRQIASRETLNGLIIGVLVHSNISA